MNSGSTGSINREWNACEVRTRRAVIPASARRLWNVRMLSSDPGNDAAAGIVDGGEIDVCRKIFGDGVGAQRHRDHDPAGRGVHQPCPHRHRLDRRRQVEDARDGGRDVLADAVSRQRRRANAVGLDQLRRARIPRRTARVGCGRCAPGFAAVPSNTSARRSIPNSSPNPAAH